MSKNEVFLRIIESQKIINNRFYDIRRINQEGGNGNFSLVFLAKDKTLRKNKDVVLKFFNPTRASVLGDYRQKCFEREAKILYRLKNQRNILPILQKLRNLEIELDYEHNKIPIQLNYYVTHKAKCSIGDYIYSEDWNLIRSIRYFREICKAVQRIHTQRIYHRDLKPENFLLFSYGYVCACDFGSACDYSEERIPILKDQDYDETEIGDPSYYSLELICNLQPSEELYRYSDFFALGAILFELFTRTRLTLIALRDPKLQVLINVIRNQKIYKRRDVFLSVISDVERQIDLPKVRSLNGELIKNISHRVDDLYMSLSRLNYKFRETDFSKIFNRINVIEKLILYDKLRNK